MIATTQTITPAVEPVQTLVLQFKDVAPAFPIELKKWNRWIVRTADKQPHSAYEEDDNRGPIDPHDPQYQAGYDTALGALELTTKYAGLGFVFNYVDGYTGVDFDDCVNPDTREIRPDVQAILTQSGSYAEFSPSATGIHIITKGWQVPIGPDGKQGHKVGDAEIYSGKRYFTVTGDHVQGTPLTVNACDIGWLYDRIVVKREFAKTRTATQNESVSPIQKPSTQIVHTGSIVTNKRDLLMHGTITSQKPFIIEDHGNSLLYESQSEADMALCTLLAMSGLDADAIDAEFRKSSLYREKWKREDYRSGTIKQAIETERKQSATITVPVLTVTEEAARVPEEVDENSVEAIPPFDPSVIKGIYAEFVDLVTRGTTLNPQYAYAIAKTVVGIRMAGNVKFEDLDVEPRFYTTLIGESGTGKGEAWRRTYHILNAPGLLCGYGFKVINDADSGAGLKDVFFPTPKTPMSTWNPEPVVCFVDEVTTLGNKSKDTRNPGILDEMITLANSTSITRSLCERNGGKRTTDKARLAIVMCGQNGEVFIKAFAGRTKLGWYDRLTPEFGAPVEVGDLPPIDTAAAVDLVLKLNSLDYSGTMTMSPEAKTLLDECWNSQSAETKKKARWRSNLKLEAYMSAFGRGLKVVEAEDARVAIKNFERQLIIRRVCFTMDAPDRVGYYLGLIKRITQHMIEQLAAGLPPEQVAKSRRDYEKATNAQRDNEEHIFTKAWETHSRVWLEPVTIRKTNGHQYTKYLPIVEGE